MQILRTITGRPSRSLLTSLGIAIGIFALVVVGALAERIQQIVGGGIAYYGTRILVQESSTGGNFFRIGTPLTLDKLDAVRKADDVRSAYPEVIMLYPDLPHAENSFGQPSFVIGRQSEANGDDPRPLTIRAGREFKAGEHNVAVIGEDLQKQTKTKVGQQIIISGSSFTVVGIFDKSFTINDTAAVIPFSDAQLLYHPILRDADPKLENNIQSLATQIIVFYKDGSDPQAVTRQINESVEGVKALDPESFKRQVESSTRLFNTIVFGAALTALLIGSLSVVNTMIMAVSERTREIGIRKALGATNGRILRSFIAEAAIIGLMGGLMGIFFGELLVFFINQKTTANGSALFQISPRLLLSAYSFSVLLAVCAGIGPAMKAARMQPIDALNRER